MDVKLTLKLRQEVIEKATHYAAVNDLTLSSLIENYLITLTTDNSSTDEIKVSDFVKSLSSKLNIPVDLDYREDHTAYFMTNRK